MIGRLELDVESWSLRELVWALHAKRRERWDHWSYALAWVINSMPTFGRRRRPTIHPNRINPYRKRQHRGIALNTGNPAAEAALDAWADRAEREQARR